MAPAAVAGVAAGAGDERRDPCVSGLTVDAAMLTRGGPYQPCVPDGLYVSARWSPLLYCVCVFHLLRTGGRAWATRGAAWLKGAPERPPGLCGLSEAPGVGGGASLSERDACGGGVHGHGEDGMRGRP